MQHREELRPTGHDRSPKMTCRERGKNFIFRGGGLNVIFGPKYRRLLSSYSPISFFNDLFSLGTAVQYN
jgi:hypothetical protein